MGVPVKPRCAVVFLMVLTLGMFVVLPAEDVLDAIYDESETLPCEVIPLNSISSSPLCSTTTQVAPNSLHQKAGVPSRPPSARVSNTEGEGASETRISLALLCTLLC